MTIRLVADFGFSGQTLGADSSLLPIAYYLHQRNAAESYLTGTGTQRDRESIRTWLFRSLLKAGVWGSGLDVTLTALRTTLQEHGAEGWPRDEIDATMARRGRPLRFELEEIKDLADMAYGDRRVFGALALLYPFVDTRNQFHIDHIFPRRDFRTTRLRKAGFGDEDIEEMAAHADRLGNLQLLEGPMNGLKSNKPPATWLTERFPTEAEQRQYL